MVWVTLGGLPTPLAIDGGHERALAPLLVLLLAGMVGGAFAGILIPLHLALKAVEDRSDRLLARGMAGGDVEELLGGLWALTSQLVNQRLTGGPRQESSYNIGVGDVRQLVALLGEAPDVPTKGFSGLLSAILEILWVPRALVRALEVPHEDLFQVRPTLDSVGRMVFQPCLRRIGQEQWKVVDNEIVIIRSTGLAGKPIILEP